MKNWVGPDTSSTRCKSVDGAPSQRSSRHGMGRVAYRPVDAGSPIASMDRCGVSQRSLSAFLSCGYTTMLGRACSPRFCSRHEQPRWQMFPSHGSHYDPRITGLILAFAAAVVTALWGPRTLLDTEMPDRVGRAASTFQSDESGIWLRFVSGRRGVELYPIAVRAHSKSDR